MPEVTNYTVNLPYPLRLAPEAEKRFFGDEINHIPACSIHKRGNRPAGQCSRNAVGRAVSVTPRRRVRQRWTRRYAVKCLRFCPVCAALPMA